QPWKREGEDGPLTRLGCGADAAAVVLDGAVDDGEAEPGAGVLGREEGVEDRLEVLGVDSLARVSDRHQRSVSFGLHGELDGAAATRAIDGVRGVAQEIP